MNLTQICLRCIAVILCLYFTSVSVRSQSLDGAEIPQPYVRFLKSNALREKGQSKDYLVHGKIGFDQSIKLLRRLEDGWSIVRIDNLDEADLEILYPVNGDWKLSHPDLGRYADQWLTLKILDGSSLSAIEYDSLIWLSGPYARVKVNENHLRSIIYHPYIQYIGLEATKARAESRVLDLNLIPNNVYKLHSVYPNYKGQSLTIGIKEDRFDPEDIDLMGRTTITEAASEVLSYHATEMATIIGGAGLTFVNGYGAAPEVQMVSSGFGDLMPESDDFYDTYGLTIQNHSYGGELESFYGASAEAYDVYSNQDPYLLHVMSSGNSGHETPASGTYAGLSGWANLTGNYKNAKNNLVIGAVDSTGVLTPFSSVGPADDGRIKPELVAYSTSGTSNAAALVSGAAILLQEAYLDAYDEKASSSLIKALLINGADDVGAEGPDFKTGFGNVDAFTSMQSLKNEYFQEGQVGSDETVEIPITLPDNTASLKITLVWNDPAANANDMVTLVNDLDLQLIDPDDNVWLPWVLDHEPNQESLSAKAARGTDQCNNVEQITLQTPASGVFTIRVVGDKLTTATQAYSVVYDYQLADEFAWNYPLEGSFMPYDGETGSYFRWSSTYGEREGKLSISLDDGENWTVLDDAVDLDRGFWRWQPDLLDGRAIARMEVGGQVFETDEFVLSHTLSVSSGFDCGDSVMIAWPQVDGITSFDLQRIENQNLATWKNVADTFSIIRGSSLKSDHWRVVPKYADNVPAIGSYMFKPVDLGTDCYISSFFGFSEEQGVSLNGNLSSRYHLDAVHFEVLGLSGFESIHSLQSLSTNVLEYLDSEPGEGVNYYRLRLELENGASLTSDTLSVYHLNEMIALIYPNPVRAGEQIALRTNVRDGLMSRIEIFDYQGNRLFDAEVAELEFLRINGSLTPGIYHYRVRNSNGSAFGKIVVY